MLDPIVISALRGRPFVLASDLLDLGIGPRRIAKAVQAGELVRIRRGAFAVPPVDRQFGQAELHRLRVRATSKLSTGMVASHLSAAAMHGLPLIGPWPTRVHVAAPGAAGGSSSAGMLAHRGGPEPEVVVVDGVMVTSLRRTLVDVASTCSMLTGVTMLDHALGALSVGRDDLRAELDRVAPVRGAHACSAAIGFADGKSGGVGESLSRVRMFELGFQAPLLQTSVTTHLGSHDVDFEWPDVDLFGEFDGYVKYSRSEYMAGRTAEQVLFDEKRREDAIRGRTGRRFLRWVWDEAYDPGRFFRLLSEAGVPRARGTR